MMETMTKEQIAYKETSGIFNSYELGITGLANAMDKYSEQESIAFLEYLLKNELASMLKAHTIEELYKRYNNDKVEL